MKFVCLSILFNSLLGQNSVNFFSSRRNQSTCDYINYSFMCGDICLNLMSTCSCGGVEFTGVVWIKDSVQYCCTPPSVQCRRTLNGASCPEGEVLEADHLYLVDVDKFVVDDSPRCNGQCFNDYLTSQYLGSFTHYSCPDKCIYWSGLCRGVSFCDGDEEICGEDLRCPEERLSGHITKHTMSTDPPRSYCFGFEDPFWGAGWASIFGGLLENNGKYDNIDRSDEDITQVDETSQTSINYQALTQCTDRSMEGNLGHNGLMCGDACLGMFVWCHEGFPTDFCDNAGVDIMNRHLCSNYTFWHNISCDVTFEIDVGNASWVDRRGKRCSGTKQHCYYPYQENIWNHLRPDMTSVAITCDDKSDRVYEVGQPCIGAIFSPLCVDAQA